MPVFTVVLRINVPGLGERTVNYAGPAAITAPDIAAAIQQARAGVIIEPIAVQKIADA